jgi:hypothetical protein
MMLEVLVETVDLVLVVEEVVLDQLCLVVEKVVMVVQV